MYRIKTITVKELFGYDGNDYTVELDPVSKINFIYGFNGCGKTTLIKLAYAAIKMQMTILDSIDFESVEIVFDNDGNKETLLVRKTIKKQFSEIAVGELQKDKTAKYYYPVVYEWVLPDGSRLDGKLYFNENVSNDFETNGNAKLSDFIDLNANYEKADIDEHLNEPRISEKLNALKNIDILFANKDYKRTIAEQRIRDKKNKDGENVLSIFDVYERSDTFPVEALRADEDTNIASKKNEKPKLEKPAEDNKDNIGWFEFVNTYRAKNNSIYDDKNGRVEIPDKTNCIADFFKYLLHMDSCQQFKIDYQMQIDPKKRYDDVLAWSTHEFHEGLLVMFETMINEKSILRDKTMHINRQDGCIEIKIKDSNKPLPIEKLSSGEKNLLLLYYYIIFSLGDNRDIVNSCGLKFESA